MFWAGFERVLLFGPYSNNDGRYNHDNSRDSDSSHGFTTSMYSGLEGLGLRVWGCGLVWRD